MMNTKRKAMEALGLGCRWWDAEASRWYNLTAQSPNDRTYHSEQFSTPGTLPQGTTNVPR
jgi:hypothetical protein